MSKPDLVRVCDGGRVVLPAEFRKAMGIKVGDLLMASVVDGELRITTRGHALERATRRIRPFIKGDASLVDELIAERRAEATRE